MGLGACAFIQHTAEAQTLKHHKRSDQSDQASDVRAATRLPVPQIYLSRSKTLSLSCHTAAASAICQIAFVHNRKHCGCVCVCPNIQVICFAFTVKKTPISVYFQTYSLGSFLGDMRGNLGRPQFSMRSVSKAFQAECEISGRLS